MAQAFTLNQQMAQQYIHIWGEVENFKLREEDEKLYCLQWDLNSQYSYQLSYRANL